MNRFPGKSILSVAVLGALLAFSAGAADKGDGADKGDRKGKSEAAAERGSAPAPAEDPMKMGPKGAKGGTPAIPGKDVVPKAATAGDPPRATKDANTPGKSDMAPNPKGPRADTDKDVEKKKK